MSEVAGSPLAIYTGILVAYMTICVCCAISSDEVGAIREHFIFKVFRNFARIPIVVTIDSLQVLAVTKHKVHGFESICFEIVQIKTFQAATALEHTGHIGYFGRIEVTQIQARQIVATTEHE